MTRDYLPDDNALRALLHDALVIEPSDALVTRHVDAAIAASTFVPPRTAARRTVTHRRRLRSPLVVRAVVVAVVSSLTMTLGLAEAGALPQPVQQIVVDVGRFAGVHFPTEKPNAAAPVTSQPTVAPNPPAAPRATAHPHAHAHAFTPPAPTTVPPPQPAPPAATTRTQPNVPSTTTTAPPTTTPSRGHTLPTPPTTTPRPPVHTPTPPVTDPPPPPPTGTGNHPGGKHHHHHHRHKHRPKPPHAHPKP